MASGTLRWKRNHSPAANSTEEELFLFGYSCKIFRDDEKAVFIDEGKHLIPWMGDETTMIDRYDVRGYLHDLTPFEREPDILDESDELFHEEQMCNEERYMDLHANMTEEELYHEEELKRLRAALASDGAYHEIEFTYNNLEPESETNAEVFVKEEEDEPYCAPEGLTVPKGMPTPSTMKIHAIIEKTAYFVNQQGGQMEIIIKMKQSDNPQFAFMQMDNPLHPYYKHLIQELKHGRFKPTIEKKKMSDENDDHYLHPSLLSSATGNVPEFTVPSINFRRTGDDSYSMLVKNLKQHIEEDKLRNSPTSEMTSSSVEGTHQRTANENKSENTFLSTCTIPTPDIQPIIDKMAEYVAKNGEDFETIVKAKKDKRFDFLNPGHIYYDYYKWKRDAAMLKSVHSIPVAPKLPSQLNPVCHSVKEETFCPKPLVSVQKGTNQDALLSANISETIEPTVSYSPEPNHVQEFPIKQCEIKTKPKVHTKAPKGPISFSLKLKESESQSLDSTKKTSAILDDSEEEEGKSHAAASQEKSISTAVPECEEKTKKLSSEELEAKIAEEKFKDKLAAAAREKLAQQKREKQLQLERKQKAASFIQMLKKKSQATPASISGGNSGKQLNANVTTVPSNVALSKGTENHSPSPGLENSPFRIIPVTSFPCSPPSTSMHGEVSSNSSSPEIGCRPPPIEPSTILPSVAIQENTEESSKRKRKHSKDKKKSHKSSSKSHKHSSSKKDKRSRSPPSSKSRLSRSPPFSKSRLSRSPPSSKSRLSRSPPSSKSRSPSSYHRMSRSPRKERKLPAAYALPQYSRSRSRSPKRYSQYSSPIPWIRRRP